VPKFRCLAEWFLCRAADAVDAVALSAQSKTLTRSACKGKCRGCFIAVTCGATYEDGKSVPQTTDRRSLVISRRRCKIFAPGANTRLALFTRMATEFRKTTVKATIWIRKPLSRLSNCAIRSCVVYNFRQGFPKTTHRPRVGIAAAEQGYASAHTIWRLVPRWPRIASRLLTGR